jgi:hypothetical protein
VNGVPYPLPDGSRIRAYLLSLCDDHERRAALLRHGVATDLVHGFQPAIDHRYVDPGTLPELQDAAATRERYGRLLRGGEVGCAASHRAVYRDLIDSGDALALVFEDDVVEVGDGFAALPPLIAELRRVDPDLAYVCHLGVPTKVRFGVRVPGYPFARIAIDDASPPRRYRRFRVVDPRRPTLWFTHAYLISRSAALRILRNEPRIRLQADDWRTRIREGSLDFLFLSPPLFLQNPAFPSNVQPAVDPASAAAIDPRSLALRLRDGYRSVVHAARSAIDAVRAVVATTVVPSS